MEKMTMKAYAVKHKLSLFNVVKLIKSGKVKSETVTEDGREKVYILLDEKEVDILSTHKNEFQKSTSGNFEIRVAQLEEDIKELYREIEILKKKLFENLEENNGCVSTHHGDENK